MKWIVLALIFVPNVCFALGEFDSMRCNNGIVSVGNSKYEVLQKCGEPTRKETVYRTVNYYGRPKTRSLQEWTYDFGPNEFVYLLHFDSSGAVIKCISTNSYGYKRLTVK